MKALVYTAPNKVEVQQVPDPKPEEGSVRVKMLYCGVCGTDIGIFHGKHPRAKAPLIIGHEFVGIIDQVLPGSKFKVGDRVCAYPLISCGECVPCKTGSPHVCKTLKLLGIDCAGGMAEYCWVKEDVLFTVPDDIPDDVAATIEPLAVVVRSVHQAEYKMLDSTVVMGAGPIGILTAIVLKHSSASRIVISDFDAARLDMCRKLGFEAVDLNKTNLVDYVAGSTDGNGVDIVFECTGSEAAAAEMTKIARIGGTLCITGVHKAPHAVNLQDLNFKEQWMIGTRVYTKAEFGRSVTLASIIKDDLKQIITQVVPLSEADKVFDMIADPAVNAVKVLVDCTK
ncbi:MAG: alcohol dehydrogenase catalytic domain-containing protein [Methylobacteriaceae bacterium]|jgi:threonine dehydrogenase-like Zn-dependent dehydrogenase|nr:alcohol dehydrogenase catalytic domain-containing protein [Methylobacteriaceae bacterium]